MTVDTIHPTLQPTHHRFIRCWRLYHQNLNVSFLEAVEWTDAWPSVHSVLKTSERAALYLDSSSHQIDRRCPHLDCWFIRCSCLLLHHFFHSFDACRIWTVGLSSGASWLESSRSVPSTLMLAPTLTSRYQFIRRCLFPPFSLHLQLVITWT
jgi:hypothetical protein